MPVLCNVELLIYLKSMDTGNRNMNVSFEAQSASDIFKDPVMSDLNARADENIESIKRIHDLFMSFQTSQPKMDFPVESMKPMPRSRKSKKLRSLGLQN